MKFKEGSFVSICRLSQQSKLLRSIFQNKEGHPLTEGTRILIVDDDPEIRENIHILLSREGFIVREAPDAEAALAILEKPMDFQSGTISLAGKKVILPEWSIRFFPCPSPLKSGQRIRADYWHLQLYP
ncbi:response regulator [Desulfosporosinus shakirovi]|uniref:response regulator n=1 Tax=Desulfosporosinus shakirovi TaxID=2885154 RepID=UPI001E2D2184|nr:response regulator [Desulfosporosinus sp. SRJS8]MCB8814660.1 response regulator [Desulfosporosinus sp. SRJS8]